MDDTFRPLLARLARDAGFTDLGIAPVSFAREQEKLRAWIEAGHHAGMSWLADTAELRLDLRRRFSWARSLIVVVKAYRPRAFVPGQETGIAQSVSAYARGRDYHEFVLDALKALGNQLEGELAPRPVRRHAYVDTGPVLERQAALAAGLGWLGKNGLLLRPKEGSWTFLGVMATDLDLSPGPVTASSLGSCGSCRACQPACPTGAFVAPGVLDSRRCISYLTIEHRGAIDRELRRAMGGWIFGCDLCQSACPVNHRALRRQPRSGPGEAASSPGLPTSSEALDSSEREDSPSPAALASRGGEDFTFPSPALTGITLPRLLALDADAFRRRFKNTPLWRPRREGLLRNALIAAANLHRLDCVDPARGLLHDPSKVLREAASWCLAELNVPAAALDDLRAAMERESDQELKRLMAQDLIRGAAATPYPG